VNDTPTSFSGKVNLAEAHLGTIAKLFPEFEEQVKAIAAKLDKAAIEAASQPGQGASGRVPTFAEIEQLLQARCSHGAHWRPGCAVRNETRDGLTLDYSLTLDGTTIFSYVCEGVSRGALSYIDGVLLPDGRMYVYSEVSGSTDSLNTGRFLYQTIADWAAHLERIW